MSYAAVHSHHAVPALQQHGDHAGALPVHQNRLAQFQSFYDRVSKSKKAMSLAATPLGYAGAERILNNDMLHHSPWQASCVELRESVSEAQQVLSYTNIDFSQLRHQRRNRGSKYVPDYGLGGGAIPGLEVVHYFETSSAEGLAGYQHVAMKVRKGVLPGNCVNYSSEGGFGVWVVPLPAYSSLLETTGLLDEGKVMSPKLRT
ncbi:hypothetical protein STCU_02314 [Strigomonas culicis]|uniref:Uncharacterized protein n=1 Tax=Strigomonas culicis TaxID=28005 RepID=S9UX13_9TRYP|nr:hypothetical protein STCU_02314 [Strigomonas culicis]|eukprot:EPY33314.1 hypothetical protein STCU_02314 [Strigomonas culicis]